MANVGSNETAQEWTPTVMPFGRRSICFRQEQPFDRPKPTGGGLNGPGCA